MLRKTYKNFTYNVNGKINTNPSNILKELERFYCKLYASSHNVPGSDQKRSSFLGELNVPKLSEEQKINCEGKISSKECFDLLDSFHNNKTPGNDGIPIEMNVLKKVRCPAPKNKL